MSDRPSTNIGDDYMQSMMEPEPRGSVDWTKPIELREQDGGTYQAILIGFDSDGCAVVRKVNYEQYTAFRRDGSLKGGSLYQFIRNKVGLDV